MINGTQEVGNRELRLLRLIATKACVRLCNQDWIRTLLRSRHTLGPPSTTRPHHREGGCFRKTEQRLKLLFLLLLISDIHITRVIQAFHHLQPSPPSPPTLNTL